MAQKIPVGNGKFCYTKNCRLHSANWARNRQKEIVEKLKSGNSKKTNSGVLSKTPLTHPNLWKKGLEQASNITLREERPEYIESIDIKHFQQSGHGSKFTDPRVNKTEDVLSLAVAQRGNLEGDDRDELIKLGAPSNAFLENCRYIKVNVNGVEALKSTAQMSDEDILTIKGKGKGADGKPRSLSVVAEVDKLSPVSYATVIIGSKLDENNKPVEGEMLWTMFPGVANKAPRSESLRDAGLDADSKITVGELRKLFGDFKVNTELK